MQVTTIGLDLAKNIFHVHGVTDDDAIAFNKPLRRAQVGRFEFLAFGKAIKAERPIILKREFDQSKLDASEELRKPLVDENTAGNAAHVEGDQNVIEVAPTGPSVKQT